jgi:hypothetical protein
MIKINKLKTETLLEKRRKLASPKDPVFTIQDEKKVFKEYGKGNESNSRHFRHVVEELERRGL